MDQTSAMHRRRFCATYITARQKRFYIVHAAHEHGSFVVAFPIFITEEGRQPCRAAPWERVYDERRVQDTLRSARRSTMSPSGILFRLTLNFISSSNPMVLSSVAST